MKRILLVVGGLIAVAAVLFLVWFFFLKSVVVEQNQPFTEDFGFGTFFDTEFQNGNDFVPDFSNLEPEDFVPQEEIPILRQLSREPVAGYIFFKEEFESVQVNEDLSEETFTDERYVFRFMERVTGHIIETKEDNLENEKVTNTTTQKIYNAIFSSDGNSVLFEKLSFDEENIDSFIGVVTETEIEEPTTETEVAEGEDVETETVEILEEKVLEIRPYSIIFDNFVPGPDLNSFAYTLKSLNSSNIEIGNFEDGDSVETLNTPLRDIVIDWPSENIINMTTKADSGEPGYSYIINTVSGNIEKIIEDIDGLTVKVSGDGNSAIYAGQINGGYNLVYRNLETREETEFTFRTLPEKCAFSNTQNNIVYCGGSINSNPSGLPESWFKGKITFNDSIWKLNTDTGRVDIFYTFDQNKFGAFDVVDIKLTEGDEFLTFLNKKDLTLWSLNLEALNNTDDIILDSEEVF
jgi:hypothetical protein